MAPPGAVCVLWDGAPLTFHHNIIMGNSGYAAFTGLYSDGSAPREPDTRFHRAEPRVPEPVEFMVGRAFPNPFNSEVTIEFATTEFLRLKLEVFDVLGRKVDTVYEGLRGPAIHTVKWNASSDASGPYFARLSGENSRQPPYLRKFVLLK